MKKASLSTKNGKTNISMITDNDALAIKIELQKGEKVILVTIYCQNGNPSLRLFRMINAFSKQVIFLGDLTQNISSLDVSNQTSLVKHLLT